ncbi:MAG: DNA-directed RNA polymerase subunit omega [Lachnospiraceae bacterium]|nr:DNA-directed RNA polymerase subunit omega [Lachnospiraceae bacterium]
MIHPSYVDLMEVVNKDVEEGETPVINSRYSIVMATAKRARQLVNQDTPLIENYYGRKPLSIAVEELNEGKIRLLSDEEAARQEEAARAMLEEMEEAEDTEEAEEAAETGSDEEVPEEEPVFEELPEEE